MSLIDTNVATLRQRLPADGMIRLCRDYGLHPEHEDGNTEMCMTEAELIGYGWLPPANQALFA